MPRFHERRRHDRMPLVCPVTLRDQGGRVVFRGRTADVSPCGMRVIGPPPANVSEDLDVWLELTVPNPRSSGPRRRLVKLCGIVHRVVDMGDWKAVVVVLQNDFCRSLLSPIL